MILSITFFALVLQASSAALLPDLSPDVEIVPRDSPACNSSQPVLFNQNFYYNELATDYESAYQTYAPWNVTPTAGSPGCKYVQGYRTCIDDTASGDADSNCFLCNYGRAGGGTTISQEITIQPGCKYELRAAVACWGANDWMGSEDTYGTPHVFFRVTLDHTVIIPQQLSCPACTSSSQTGCVDYPNPTYREAVGTVVGPASGKGTIKILISQASETVATSPLLLTQLGMYLVK